MTQYRKRPVTIDAWHWTFTPGCEQSPSWMNDAMNAGPHTEGGAAFWPDGNHGNGDVAWATKPHISIHTLEGVMYAQPGDWIIRGVKGELYPVKDDIFLSTYEDARVSPPPSRLRECLGFFASVIKSGEPWTDTCERKYREALMS